MTCEQCHGDTHGVWAKLIDEPRRCIHCMAKALSTAREYERKVLSKLERIETMVETMANGRRFSAG